MKVVHHFRKGKTKLYLWLSCGHKAIANSYKDISDHPCEKCNEFTNRLRKQRLDRYMNMLYDRVMGEMTYAELGKRHSISRARVQVICEKAKRLLRHPSRTNEVARLPEKLRNAINL